MTWHEVQTKLLDVQKEQQMCIHKTELTQLGETNYRHSGIVDRASTCLGGGG